MHQISKITLALIISGSMFGGLHSVHAKPIRHSQLLKTKRTNQNNKYLKRIFTKYHDKYGINLNEEKPQELSNEDLLIATEELGKDFMKLKRESSDSGFSQEATNQVRKLGISLSKELQARVESGNFTQSTFTYNEADGINTGI